MSRNVVHWQMVQVGLNELKGLIFNHLDALRGHAVLVFLELSTVDTQAILAILQSLV